MKLIFGRKVITVVDNGKIGSQLQLTLQARQIDVVRVQELKQLCEATIAYIDNVYDDDKTKFTVGCVVGKTHTETASTSNIKKMKKIAKETDRIAKETQDKAAHLGKDNAKPTRKAKK